MASPTKLNQDEALALMAESFGCDVHSLTPDTDRDAVPGWDSMGALMLIAELDERFGLELPAETSRAMRNVADVLAFLRERGVLGDGS